MELEIYKKSNFYEDYISSQNEYYEREQVDTLLAEKDREIALLKERICNGDVSRLTWIDDCFDKDKEIAELKAKLEDAKATHYAESVDAGMRERRLKRALWLARFLCAVAVAQASHGAQDYQEEKVWTRVSDKCRAMADKLR